MVFENAHLDGARKYRKASWGAGTYIVGTLMVPRIASTQCRKGTKAQRTALIHLSFAATLAIQHMRAAWDFGSNFVSCFVRVVEAWLVAGGEHTMTRGD